MSTTTTTATTRPPEGATRPAARNALYSALIGLSTLVVLLQGLWAGLFIREGQDYRANWVAWHARGAELAIALAALATIVALVKMRSRRDLIVGGVVFTVLLIVESYIGGIVGNHPGLTTLHIPLAMALMGLAVWLPFRSSRR